MRIVGGSLRGRALATPNDDRTRPTSDRVRESVFNMLSHGAAALTWPQTRVIDLFAGTGAMGLEAVSRGANYALFVEDDPVARAVIRTNIEAFGLTGVTKIFRRDATGLGAATQMGSFDLALLDPPYGKALGEAALVSLVAGGWLNPNATIVLEERRDAAIALPTQFTIVDQRTYGHTQVVIARFNQAP
jgi:16S rRNA (guanine966-N2)-methyltransferase